MRLILILVLLFFFAFGLHAQLGVNGKYIATKDWWKIREQIRPGQTSGWVPLEHGWVVGIDYNLKLKNIRIEFLPELNYADLRKSNRLYYIPYKNLTSILSLFFNTNFYFLDLKGDRNGNISWKPGSVLTKGLFFQLSPGISHWWMIDGPVDELIVDSKFFSISIGGSIGIDIDINNLLTLTPMFTVRANQDTKIGISNLANIQTTKDAYASPVFWSTGLRVGLNLGQ